MSETELVLVHDLIDPKTGKSYRDGNLRTRHNIPLGSLVEVKFDDWFGDGACWKVHARLWVVSHNRDCDGTPLYTLSRWKDPTFATAVGGFYCGFSEESLSVIEVTPVLCEGVGALDWNP